jgi:hypothetical protein
MVMMFLNVLVKKPQFLFRDAHTLSLTHLNVKGRYSFALSMRS